MKKKKLLALLLALFFTTAASAQYWLLAGNTLTSTGILGGNSGNYDIIFKRNGVQSGLLNSANSNTSWGVGALNPSTTGTLNLGLGYQALYSNTSGANNIANGPAALYYNTTGGNNIAIGVDALNANTAGTVNIGIGSYSLIRNVASGNTATGYESLSYNTSGTNNVANGYQALLTSATGSYNTAIGFQADVANGSVSYGVSLGYSARAISNQLAISPNISLISATGLPTGVGYVLTDVAGNGNLSLQPNSAAGTAWSLTGNSGTTPGTNFMGTTDDEDVVFKRNNVQSGLLDNNYENTSWGVGALNPLTTGYANVAIGYQSLYSNTGFGNIANGYQALYTNTSGGGNVATGYQALYSNTSGGDNVATGYQALQNNTTGYEDAAIGNYTLENNTTGQLNVACGGQALQYNTTGDQNTAEGVYALGSNTTGSFNVGIGDNANSNNTTGSENTAIGQGSGVGSGNLTNATAIGNQAVVNASNTMSFGATNVIGWGFGNSTIPAGDALIVGTSGSPNGNGAYLTAGGVWTNTSDKNLKEDISTPDGKDILSRIKQLPVAKWKYKGTSEYHIGPMAQDFYNQFNLGTDNTHISTVDPAGVALIAIKELAAQNDSLQNANAQQQQINNNLQQQLNDLKTTISQMQTAMSQCCNSYSSNMTKEAAAPVVTGADVPTLQQNTPNPYNGSTVIGYYLPQSTTNAEIIVSDLTGNVLKSISLTGNGNGQITFTAGSLASGSYFYTLLVNGQKIDTKQMVLAY